MEKKTIGQFIAALRKVNGMTQRELAEKLNVSDKAVSRWERDENAPDLSLIPVIAELFGVTSDEILRGERIIRSEETSEKSDEKSDKQIKHLLNDTKNKFRMYSVISVSVGIIAILAAMLGNFVFTSGWGGYIFCVMFCIPAIVAEIIFTLRAFGAVSDFESDKVNDAKRSIFETACKVIAFIFTVLVSMLPLIVYVYSSFVALSGYDFLKYALIYAAAAIILSYFACAIAYRIGIWCGLYCVTEDIAEQKRANRRKVKYLSVTAGVLAMLFIGQFILNTVDKYNFIEGKTFTDTSEFVQYIETPEQNTSPEGMDFTQITDGFDEVYQKEYITDHDDNILLEYIHRNENVYVSGYILDNGEIKSITTYRKYELSNAILFVDRINVLFIALYFTIPLAAIIIYTVRKKKKK
ncbi:MAG: helix-turn-helix transcriptional regulator [Eubacterium sp.]|nr:helix-turn-helix transcriptional regulator [Eubacterium sp.]